MPKNRLTRQVLSCGSTPPLLVCLFSLSFVSFRSDAQHQEPERGWQESSLKLCGADANRATVSSSAPCEHRGIRYELSLFVFCVCWWRCNLRRPRHSAGILFRSASSWNGSGPTMSFHGRMCTNTNSIRLYRFYFIAQLPNHSRTQCFCLIFLLYE